MRRSRAFAAAAVAMVALSAGAFARADGAPASATTLIPASESWYTVDPTCAISSTVGCASTTVGATAPAPPVAVPSSTYPSGTLHVAWTSGTETSLSYLGFSFAPPGGQRLTAAVLTVPLDTDSQDGSLMPDTAKIAVCATASPVAASSGTISQPPPVACTGATDLTYSAAPVPELVGDVSAVLAGGTVSALALLPDASTNTANDNWQAVFSSHDRGSGSPATLRLTFAPASSASSQPAPTYSAAQSLAVTTAPASPSRHSTPSRRASSAPVTQAAPPAGALSTTPLTASTGPTTVPAATVPSAVGEAPIVAATAAATSPPARQIQLHLQLSGSKSLTVGYYYPAAWLLPFALLVFGYLAFRTLTKDLSVQPE